MEVNEAFLATKVVRGIICHYIKNTDAIKSILLVIIWFFWRKIMKLFKL